MVERKRFYPNEAYLWVRRVRKNRLQPARRCLIMTILYMSGIVKYMIKNTNIYKPRIKKIIKITLLALVVMIDLFLLYVAVVCPVLLGLASKLSKSVF